jgi:drug/metabolite transporter (DMT)-like permease
LFALSLSLVACLGWGIADFIGGLKSRYMPTLTVLILTNVFGLGTLLVIGLFRGTQTPPESILLWGAAGGLVAVAAMVLLYRALAVGSMSIIAPISATGVILPVTVGIILGDELTRLQAVGIVSAIAGAILAGRERSRQGEVKATAGVWLAVGAALAIGLYFIVIDRASDVDPFWAAVFIRLSYGSILLLLLAALRPPLRVGRPHLPALAASGTLDAVAGLSFALATSLGMLTIVSVVGSLYPAVTVILSTMILKERPHPVQVIGVGLALAGVVLISAG